MELSLEYRPFELDLVKPFETAQGTITSRRGFLVKLQYGDDVGIGEATPLPGWTESFEECERALERAVTALDAGGSSAALSAAEEAVAARHGVSLAIADLYATRAARPLYQYLGDGTRVARVPVNATIGDADPGATASAARAAVDRRFRCCKLKVGLRSVEADVERVRRTREAVGDGIELRVDANGAWTYEEALEAIDYFANDVSIVEQPLPGGALEGHADLRGYGPKIALDEGLLEHGIDAIQEAGAADVVVLKPMALGGVDVAQSMITWLQEVGIEPLVTTTIDGMVARTAAVHLAAAIPDVAPCGLATGDLLASDLGRDPIFFEKGAAVVPQAKGLGIGDIWSE